MTSSSTRHFLLVIATLGFAPAVRAQTAAYCRPVDGLAQSLRLWVGQVATGTDSVAAADRARYGIPTTTWSDVSIVTDSRTCQAGGEAYSREVQVAPPGGRSVIVVKVGTVYVVEDPTVKVKKWQQGMIFTRRWVLLSRFVG